MILTLSFKLQILFLIFYKMASEIIKKFDEIQEQKHGKKEIQIDEFEWIEVNEITTLIKSLEIIKYLF